MKIMKKIGIFALVVILLFSIMSLSVFAAGESQDGSSAAQDGKLDMGLKPEGFNDRLGYAVQGTVTGILMVFAVLTLLCLILYASKLFFYDIPNRKKEKKIARKDAKVEAGIAEQKEKSASEEGVIAGCNFWGWGGSGRPDSLVWSPGDDLLCDPPHEPQGWYSVFDTDTTTIAIISQSTQRLNNYK